MPWGDNPPMPGMAVEELPYQRRPEFKRWRAYFNRRDDFPVLWCVDEGSIRSQVRVQRILFNGVTGGFTTDMGVNPTILQYSGGVGSAWAQGPRQ